MREKSFYCDGSVKNHDLIERLKLNPDDTIFFFNRFEYEVFLGYLYLGFKEKIDYSDFKNRLDLFSSTLESILYNNYLVQGHQREKEKMFLSGIKVVADTVEANSPFTRKHSDRVEKVARFLAEKLGFPYERKYILSVACILHDIGKVGIDSRIVYKPGTLTPAERKIMEKHPELGSKIVKNLYGFKIDHFIRHHHERWDGGGYPDGLKGEEIPFESRIIALADAFDSMITDRPYRTGMPLNDVIEEIKRCAGTQFDPDLSAIFLETLTDNIANFKLQILSEAG
jgi:HD-GYP domain-containing protein (c-di-GMP phosphodiesterase class II)